ncbi:MAG: hypothetical protein JRN20_13415 [Nitrososphaerota archaeon]|jgi:hypothetical protein|nr:hypothetical protein [Nitrososphaerota archaeon]MDG6923726.1 hypothetical protein [Nitrososphaerota archaeon]
MEALKSRTRGRWLDEHLDNFMIRLGHLKAIAITFDYKIRSKDSAVRRTKEAICREVRLRVDSDDDLSSYISQKSFEGVRRKSRFDDIAKTETGALIWRSGRLRNQQVTDYGFQLQDVYLSSNLLPSNLGAVPEENIHELVDWASWLGLLSRSNYAKTVWGELLSSITPPSEIAALRDGKRSPNPYLIGRERSFFLFILLGLDGGIILRMLRSTNEDQEFTRDSVLATFLSNLQELSRVLSGHGTYGVVNELRDLRELTDTIKRELDSKSRPITGLMRVSPRLENLVDLGILDNVSKSDHLRFEYIYRKNRRGMVMAQYANRILGEPSEVQESRQFTDRVGSFLKKEFFGSVNETYETGCRRIDSPKDILPHFVRAYRLLARSIGPRPILPLAVVAGIKAMEEGVFFECEQVEGALLELSREYPGKIRLSGGRYEQGVEMVVLDKSLVEDAK